MNQDDIFVMPGERTRSQSLDELRIQHPFLPIVPNSYVVKSYRFTGSETAPINIPLPSGTKMVLIKCSPYMIRDNDVYCNFHGTASDMDGINATTQESGDNTFPLTNSFEFFHVENTNSISFYAPMNSGVVSVFCFIQG